MRNPALEAPELEMIDFIERSIKEIIGFCGGAQNEKSGPGDSRTRSEIFYKEGY